MHLSWHCRECKCTTKFDECAVFYRHRNEATRLIVQAWRVNNNGSARVSQPSVNAHKEIKCLNGYLSRVPPRVRTDRYHILPGHAQISFVSRYFLFGHCVPFQLLGGDCNVFSRVSMFARHVFQLEHYLVVEVLICTSSVRFKHFVISALVHCQNTVKVLFSHDIWKHLLWNICRELQGIHDFLPFLGALTMWNVKHYTKHILIKEQSSHKPHLYLYC